MCTMLKTFLLLEKNEKERGRENKEEWKRNKNMKQRELGLYC